VPVKLTHPDKLLWPERGLTKADLLAYYEASAERLLPQIAGRPLTLKRFNNRTHRELIIIDGSIAFIGGAGIAACCDQGGARYSRYFKDSAASLSPAVD